MDMYKETKVHALIALLLILSVTAKQSFAIVNHLSWSSTATRFDLVFSSDEPIRDLVKLETDANNYLTSSLTNCTNHSACLFKNGKFLESFHVNNNISHQSLFTSNNPLGSDAELTHDPLETQCDTGNVIKIVHYCNTHWNPPVYINRNGCRHLIEWHSPLRCSPDSTNHERPCYTYDPNGKLIDLTAWILSNGSSHTVGLESTNISTIKNFRLNVCNEAHDECGPNISSCYIDEKLGTVESGYNNLTSIKYDTKENAILLTSLGHYKHQCEGDRIKTVIRFTCKKMASSLFKGPKLIRSTPCENIIEWPTIKACPVSDVTTPATNCKIRYEPLGVEIDVMELVNNRTTIEVPNISLNGVSQKMILGICRGLPRALKCEGKTLATTMACLVDSGASNTSQIVGSVTKSLIRLSDGRIYLESLTQNKTCSEPVRDGFNVTQRVGTRIEFFCSSHQQDLPTFLGYDDCTYVFEWGSPQLCMEPVKLSKVESADVVVKNVTNVTKDVGVKKVVKNIEFKNVDLKNAIKSDSISKVTNLANNNAPKDNGHTEFPKYEGAHKYFMITLIMFSFVAFVVVIFILDRKTKLRVTLRQPYSRVVNDLDL